MRKSLMIVVWMLLGVTVSLEAQSQPQCTNDFKIERVGRTSSNVEVWNVTAYEVIAYREPITIKSKPICFTDKITIRLRLASTDGNDAFSIRERMAQVAGEAMMYWSANDKVTVGIPAHYLMGSATISED